MDRVAGEFGESQPHPRRRVTASPSERVDGEDVCDSESLGELAAGVTALVADQVDPDEPGRLVIPVGPGADRDL